MSLNAHVVMELFESELSRFHDLKAARGLRRFAVAPRLEHRPWSYGPPGQTHPCWIVVEDTKSQTALAYCESGFGPQFPWGLLWTQGSGESQNMGMDCSWYPTLEGAFLESVPGAEFDKRKGAREHFLGQRDLISLLLENGHTKAANKLESLRICNTSNDAVSLLIELRNEICEFRAKNDDSSIKINILMEQNIEAFKNSCR
jgi:hypothetical protein